MKKDSIIYIAGAETSIGIPIEDQLKQKGYTNVIAPSSEDLVLTNAIEVEYFFSQETPEYVFLVAGTSGGIYANQIYPAELMHENLLVECNVIHNAYRFNVKKLLYLSSSCCYPKRCRQPMHPSALLTGPLEPTSEFYAISKIAGIKLCQAYNLQHGSNFVTGIPANVFGLFDDFSLETSHVIPALIWKMHEANKSDCYQPVEIWGSGMPRREFIFTEDLADASIFIMQKYEGAEPINIGTGENLTIKELAFLIKDVVNYDGKLYFDTTKPDGMMLKSLDSAVLYQMGWKPKTTFQSAVTKTYNWFLNSLDSVF